MTPKQAKFVAFWQSLTSRPDAEKGLSQSGFSGSLAKILHPHAFVSVAAVFAFVFNYTHLIFRGSEISLHGAVLCGLCSFFLPLSFLLYSLVDTDKPIVAASQLILLDSTLYFPHTCRQTLR
jgi:hypothetical protein